MKSRFLKYGIFIIVIAGKFTSSFCQINNFPDSLVVKPERLNKDIVWTIDSLMQLHIFNFSRSQKENNNTADAAETKKMRFSDLPDVLFEYRFEEMNRSSVIHFDYNADVRRFIDLFANKRKESYSRILGLSTMYFPLFEEYLEKHRLPLELKYLPVIESALNPLARSSSDAIGLWQLKLYESRMFNLEVNSVIDERMDPGKSTEAACEYLEYLYSVFRDWQLTLAAFNGGPGVVRNAIQRSGGKTNFWAIRSFMPPKTQDYVPAFFAAAYMMKYANMHNIDPVYPDYDFWHTDTVMLSYTIQLQQISAIIDVPLDVLRFLNPMYKAGFIPEMGKAMPLMLPSEKVIAFIRHENDILGKKLEVVDYNLSLKKSSSTENKTMGVYTVQKGDFLHKIAYEHNCSIENIREWNKLKDDTLRPGQLIVFWSPGMDPGTTIKSDSLQLHMQKSDIDSLKYLEYKIHTGETLWTIAGKYKGTTVTEIMKVNEILDEKAIKAGQILKIPVHN